MWSEIDFLAFEPYGFHTSGNIYGTKDESFVMDDIEKSRVRLVHWIDHNVEHLKGYGEVATTLEKAGLNVVAGKIREGIHLIEAANREFQKALGELAALTGQTAAPDASHHTHSHSHEEDHEHSHHHSHDRGHSHHHED